MQLTNSFSGKEGCFYTPQVYRTKQRGCYSGIAAVGRGSVANPSAMSPDLRVGGTLLHFELSRTSCLSGPNLARSQERSPTGSSRQNIGKQANLLRICAAITPLSNLF
jgi:hypothetical protein